jgi:branched-chain amino acid transport system ATP-binding protein
MLEVNGVTKQIGGLLAVHNVDLKVDEGKIVGLVGPNGAGKTTLLNIISGLSHPNKGQITFKGENITYWKPEQICRKGIAKTFQHVHLFPELTAIECVMVGAIFGNSHTVGLDEGRRTGEELLRFVGILPEKQEILIHNMNVVELKRVQLARALASKPTLLLLDELTTGLTPKESNDAIDLLRKIRERGISILLIEHVMRVITGVSDKIVVLDHGEKIAEGRPYEVMNNQRVIDTYLGDIDAF